ncbi:MAG TPA: hypothetical protein VGR22_03210 [Thermomicrobiales bacterium]|nr:hypothetical protein [Thermomicrobiales bacterium]
MHPRRILRGTVLVLLASLTMFAVAGGSHAQVADDTRAALAAIALTAAEMPSGYELVGEAFVGPDGGPIAGEVPAVLTDAGFLGAYMSVYENADGTVTITSYASAWTDADAAETAFALLETEDAGETDESLDAGDGPAELTVVGETMDATFVVDRFVVGVAATGSDIDRDDVMALVTLLESRANAVADGQFPAGTDAALPASVLDTSALGTQVRAGYLSATESEQLYGLTGSALGGMQASWVSLVTVGDGGEPPYVAIAASNFESADNAARVVDQAEDLVPLTVDLQPVEGITVEDADTARGFQYSSTMSGTTDTPDSVRVVAQVGDQVVVVDVQGATSAEEVQAAAVSLANAQVACMMEEGNCELPEVTLGGA